MGISSANRIVTLGEGDVSALHIGFKGAMNALFLVDLAAKTRRGLEGRVRAGRATGQAPYGYRRVTRILRPDGEIDRGLRELVPEEVAIVRRVFAEFASGHSPGVQARRLNAEGIPGPNSVGWSAMALRGRPSHEDGILRNRAYLGEIVWNRRHRVVDPVTGQHHRRLNTPEQRVTGHAPELRIIDDATWQRVQARLQAAAAPISPKSGGFMFWEKRKSRHLLSGKLACGACAGAFSAKSGHRYTCNQATRGLCDNRLVMHRQFLEEQVLGILANNMMDPELARAFAAELTAEWTRLMATEGNGSEQLKRELEATERKLANLVDAIADGLRSAGLQARLIALEVERDRLAKALAEVKPAKLRLVPNLGEADRKTLADLRTRIDVEHDPEAVEIARSLIDKVIPHGTKPKTPPHIIVEGQLARMIHTAQPNLPGHADTAILTVKKRLRGNAPHSRAKV